MSAPHYPREVWFDIETLVSSAQPSSIALIGDFGDGFLEAFKQQNDVLGNHCDIIALGPEKVSTSTHLVDMAIIANSLEYLDKAQATQILSRCRDMLSKQFCLCLPIGSSNDTKLSTWTLNELFALGLKRNASYQFTGQEFGLFSYRIQDYKKTPDWLNADNWANPEMWGKYWW